MELTRHTVTIGNETLTYARFKRYYVCDDCGGVPVERHEYVDDQWEHSLECGACGGTSFIRASTYQRQVGEAMEIRRNLPPQLAALVDEVYGEREPVTVDQAIADLYPEQKGE